jgi:hypothetical protein
MPLRTVQPVQFSAYPSFGVEFALFAEKGRIAEYHSVHLMDLCRDKVHIIAQVAGLLQLAAYIPHRGAFRTSTIRGRLLVISDLIECSDELNQYKNGYRWSDV